jgi:ankyrin repeat protein
VSIDPSSASRQLPSRPNLRHLKSQARDLLAAGAAASLTDAQFQVARMYGFASWPKLKAHVEALDETAQLKHAIDVNDVDRVKALMTRNPQLHRAAMGYGGDGPLTWAAECRGAASPPSAERLAIAEWMLANGSDVHQGGDGPLMRAALSRHRIPMMELLLAHGADVNAEWHGDFPIVFAPCEAVDPVALAWLLDRGANPNCPNPRRRYPGVALDYVIESYVRSPQLGACIDLLVAAGAATRYPQVVVDLLRGDLRRVAAHLDAEPALLTMHFAELDFGTTGGRRLTLRGSTLLHVAAEYQHVEAIRLLLERGADVNARAAVDEGGVGGQTAIFHAVTQWQDAGLAAVRLLVERGADLSVRAKVPGSYERPEEFVECTALGYVMRLEHEPRRSDKAETVAFLRALGAAEHAEPPR